MAERTIRRVGATTGLRTASRSSTNVLGDLIIRAVKRFLTLTLLGVPVYEASAVEPVYLDCSKERQTLQGFIEPRHNFIRVFKDERMEILDESWSWWSDRPNAGPDSYTVRHEHGFSELDRKTLILKIYWSRFDRTNHGVRQCKIVGLDLIQDQIEKGRAKVDENRRKAEARKKQKNIL
jgi:hypothetical protein